MVDAVVLAGSTNNGPLKECSPVRHEALIPIGDKTMVEHVVDALLKVLKDIPDEQVGQDAGEEASRTGYDQVGIQDGPHSFRIRPRFLRLQEDALDGLSGHGYG